MGCGRSGTMVMAAAALLVTDALAQLDADAAPPVLSVFIGEDGPPGCVLAPEVEKLSMAVPCDVCNAHPSELIGYNYLSCNNDTYMADTRWLYGCDPTCTNCTADVETSEGLCTPIANVTITNGTTGISYTFTNGSLPDSLFCDEDGYVDPASAFYTRRWTPMTGSNCPTYEVKPDVVVTGKMYTNISGNCVPDGYGEWYQLSKSIDAENGTVLVGDLGCDSSACERCEIKVDRWKIDGCNDETDWATNPITIMLSECTAKPNPEPQHDSNNTVPMELLAVGILVLVLAGFFLGQACHRATKAKFGVNRSLNSDSPDDSLLAGALARDTSGRVAYGTSGIVRKEASLKMTRADGGQVAPIVASEKVAAAVHAENAERARGVKSMKL